MHFMFCKKEWVSCGMVLAALSLFSTVQAEELTYIFTGVLPAGASSHSQVADLETFTATFTIDPFVADSDPGTNGKYNNAVLAGQMVFSGGYESQFDVTGYNVLVSNNDAGFDLVQISNNGIPGSLIVQAVTDNLGSNDSDDLPSNNSMIHPMPATLSSPYFQLSLTDDEGTVHYTATDANNIHFRAKDGFAWSNLDGASSPFYDIGSNWLSGLESGAPIDASDSAIFTAVGSYDVWWDFVTANRICEDLFITNGNVTFDNRDGGPYTLTVDNNARIDAPASLTLGDGTDTVNLDTGSMMIDGEMNVHTGTEVNVGAFTWIGRVSEGTLSIDGPDAIFNSGTAFFIVGFFDHGILSVTGGATVFSDTPLARLGNGTGTQGTVMVHGFDSTWDVTGTLMLGNSETSGQMFIDDDGRVEAGLNVAIGNDGGHSVPSFIENNGGFLIAGNDILVGGSGGARLAIANGGIVDAGNRIVVSSPSTVEISGGGNNLLLAEIIENNGLIEIANVGLTQLAANSISNTGEIHSVGLADTIIVGTLDLGNGIVQTDENAAFEMFGPVFGLGEFTGPGLVVFENDFYPIGIGLVGTISFEGDLLLNDASNLTIDVNFITPQSDCLEIAGNLHIDGALEVNPVAGTEPGTGEIFPIVSVDGTLSGGFTGLPEGATVGTYGATDLKITYAGGDGNDVELFTDPEFLLGDVNLDGAVNLLDVAPFVSLVSSGVYQLEADVNQDGVVNLLDVAPFVGLLSST